MRVERVDDLYRSKSYARPSAAASETTRSFELVGPASTVVVGLRREVLVVGTVRRAARLLEVERKAAPVDLDFVSALIVPTARSERRLPM